MDDSPQELLKPLGQGWSQSTLLIIILAGSALVIFVLGYKIGLKLSYDHFKPILDSCKDIRPWLNY